MLYLVVVILFIGGTCAQSEGPPADSNSTISTSRPELPPVEVDDVVIGGNDTMDMSVTMDQNATVSEAASAATNETSRSEGAEPMSSTEAPTTTTTTTTIPTTTVSRETLRTAPNAVVSNEGCFGLRAAANETEFEKFHPERGEWVLFKCPDPLIWDDSKCRCEARPFNFGSGICAGYRQLAGDPTQYQRVVHGAWLETPFACPVNQIWSQETCRCEFGPAGAVLPGAPVVRPRGLCPPLLNATFNTGIKDDSLNRRSIGRTPWETVTLAPDADGSDGGAARVQRGSLTLWFTGSNDFGTMFQFIVRFRLEQNSAGDDDVVIMSNPPCFGGGQTFAMSYRPSTRTYSVYMVTRQVTDTVSCDVPSVEPYGWSTFAVTYEQGTLTVAVNGQQCLQTESFPSGFVSTPCYLGVGGFNFDGYIDDVVMRKVCVEPADRGREI